MEIQDHRQRVAAERRERMRFRLLSTALDLVAAKGPASTSIDDVISAADVSRGTFYKYFPSPDALIREVAVELANDLIRMAEPVVLQYRDPAERVACGLRIVSRLAIHIPVVAAFLAQLGWPDTQNPAMLLEFVRRDLAAGMRQGRFKKMPMELALNVMSGTALGSLHAMARPGCERDFAEQATAAALRAFGVETKEADRIANLPLQPMQLVATSLLADRMTEMPGVEKATISAGKGARSRRPANR